MPAAPKLTCAGPGCRNRFVPKRSTGKFCSPGCSQRARRGTKKPAAKPVAKKSSKPAEKAAATKRTESSSDGSTSATDNHDLVVALRQELETAEALETFEGQLALELAKRLVRADSNASALADKVRSARAAALEQAGTKPDAGPTPAPKSEDDEVTRARARREEARQAARLT